MRAIVRHYGRNKKRLSISFSFFSLIRCIAKRMSWSIVCARKRLLSSYGDSFDCDLRKLWKTFVCDVCRAATNEFNMVSRFIDCAHLLFSMFRCGTTSSGNLTSLFAIVAGMQCYCCRCHWYNFYC